MAGGDIAAAVNHLRYYAGWPTKIEGETIPVSARDVLCYTLREPVGVCAQIVPWNFPLLMAIWKVAPALAAGCPIVLKPAEQTPLSALRLGELALEAGFPEGTLNVLTGDGETGAALVDHPGRGQGRVHGLDGRRARDRRQVREGAEAGDARAGRQEPEHHPARRRPRRGHQGLVPGHLLQLRPVLQRGLAPVRPLEPVRRGRRGPRRSSRARRKVGPGLDPESQFGPLVSAGAVRSRQRATSTRGSPRAPRRSWAAPPNGNGDGWFVDPTLFTGVSDEMKIAREEIFGPVLVAMPFDDLEEVAARANDTEYGLAAGLWTRDISNAHKLAGMLEGRQHLHQHVGRRRPGRALRRLQGVGHRPREGPRQPRRLPRDQDGLDPALAGRPQLSELRAVFSGTQAQKRLRRLG